MREINCYQDRNLFILLTTLAELFPWLFFHAKQECLFIITSIMYSSDIIFSCFTCFPVFVRGKYNFSSVLFAKCDRDRHLDKLIRQTKDWIQAFLSLNPILLKKSVNRTLINLELHEPFFWYPDCRSLRSAEPKEVPLKRASCRSWTNDHLLSPNTIVLPQEKGEGTGVESISPTAILFAWLHLTAPDVTLNWVLAGTVEKTQYQWLSIKWEGWSSVAKTYE